MADRIGLNVHADSGPGVLFQLTGVIARFEGDIVEVDIVAAAPDEAHIYFEIDVAAAPGPLIDALQSLVIVRRVEIVGTLQTIYGKRIIIMGGGAQVGQVAIGAISEADRHNIRGEHISVDTIVRAATGLPK